MTTYSNILNMPTRQTDPLTQDQVKNNQGGYVWAVSKWDVLRRFLILGSESGTFYASPKKLTQENAQNAIACIKEDPRRALTQIIEVSHLGLSAKNDACIFALSLLLTHCKDQEVLQLAYSFIPRIARTGTHLFQFMEDVNAMRGWSRGLRKAVANWYLTKPAEDLEYQLLKYKQRNGWTHKDVLRLCHAKADRIEMKTLLSYAVKGTVCEKHSSERVKYLSSGIFRTPIMQGIKKHSLTREMIPTEALQIAAVWSALLEKMPMHATLRNLAKMTQVGLLNNNLGAAEKIVYDRLTNAQYVERSRLHPIAILNALRVYAQGHGDKGKLTWQPVQLIKDALDKAFYLSFKNVPPTKKRLMLGVDVSGSMDGNMIAGTSLDARAAACALALVTARVEPFTEICLFGHQLLKANIGENVSLENLIAEAKKIPFGGTDCALPMIHAIKAKLPVDCFVIYTDNETAHGAMHPMDALRKYREFSGINAKLVIVGMCSSGFTIADPNDKGCMDIVGFSTEVPALINDFIVNG